VNRPNRSSREIRISQLKMLRELVAEGERLEESDSDDAHYPPDTRLAFQDMLTKLEDGYYNELSGKQESFVKGVYVKVFPSENGEPIVLVSSGEIPKGKDVETPECLRRENLPLRPPGRKVS
jgi:hypothetical protein